MARMPLVFGGGLWTATDPRAVPAGMGQTVENVALDRDPLGRPVGARVRDGYSLYAEGGSAQGIVTGGVEFPQNQGVDTELLWYYNGALRRSTAGTTIQVDPASPTAALNISGITKFAMRRDPQDNVDKAFFMADSGIWRYDGAWLMNLKGTTVTYSPNLSANPPEEPNRLADTTDEIHNARTIGVAWDSIAFGYQDRLYLTHSLRTDYVPINNYWDIVSDRGDWITAIYSGMRGAVIIGKSRSIWVLRGTDFESSTRELVSRRVGIPSLSTMQAAEELGGILFQGSDGQVYLMDEQGGLPILVSEPVFPILDALDRSNIRWAHAWLWDSKYWIRLPTATAIPQVTMSFDLRSRAWAYHPTYPTGLLAFEYQGIPLLGGISRAELWRADNGTTDNGTAITGTYRTGLMAPAGPSAKHLYRELYLTVAGNGDLTVTITVDGETRVRTISLTTWYKEHRLAVNAPGKWIDVELSGTDWHVLSPAAVEYVVLNVGRES